MNLLESLKMATQTLISNKLRSSLTMLGIAIGNASVIGMIGVGEGTQTLATDQFKSLGPNTLFILPGSPKAQNIRSGGTPPTLVLSDARAIARQVPSVAGVAPVLQNSFVVNYQSVTTTSIIQGTTADFPAVRNFAVDKGRFVNAQDVKQDKQVAMVGTDIAQRLFGNNNPIGKQIRINNVSFEVVGLMESKGSSFGSNQDDAIFVPITTMSKRIIGRTSPYGLRLSLISVSAKSSESMDAAEFQITNLLRQRHKIVGEDDFTVRNQKDALTIVSTITGALTLLLGAIAGISLLVGGIGVMNIMLVSVTERTQEIGLRKAIGATQNDILTQFTIEAIVLSIVGGIIGTSVGIGGIILVRNFSPLKTAAISPSAIVLAVSVSGGIGLFFGVVPARQAAKLDPIEALRSA
ncbi:ABC transporter permease [Chamaesiphon sp. VAR_69_metabat_338]|uniref:ABC transporter permease n=1 Tax=Chamaesiphon sp. VAR_69_metabat_338 TaxID=2964704 RepID=UPI00286D6DA1|nr:ABC transporter permease [Chamaesiphon sp. VAR_69_metabat_338]